MPTNILRKRNTKVSAVTTAPRARRSARRCIVIAANGIERTARLLDTPTADRIWAALPLFSSAEVWGQAIKFEVPVESGREADAVALASRDTLYFWPDESRVILAPGQTPISRPGEIRLPVPCNAWATTDEDLGDFSKVKPGQQVSIAKLPTPASKRSA